MTHPGERIQIDVKVVPRGCITNPELKLHQYTAIDEFSRHHILGAYDAHSTFSSADFLRMVVRKFARLGVRMECVQTDNSFEFTKRFSASRRDFPTLIEDTAVEVGICRKSIPPSPQGTTTGLNAVIERIRNVSTISTASTPSPTTAPSLPSTSAAPTPYRCVPFAGYPRGNLYLPSLSKMFNKPTCTGDLNQIARLTGPSSICYNRSKAFE